jgi:hypothetical protein
MPAHEAAPSPRDRRLSWALATAVGGALFLAFLTAGGRATSASEFPLDDAWIHQVYARGLLHDGRPTYGGISEAGFSSLAWLLALLPTAGVARILHASPVLLAKLTSLAFAIAGAVALGDVARAIAGTRRAALTTIAIALLSAGGAFAAASAMEVTLASAAMAFGVRALLDDRPRAPWRAGAWLALAVLTRLEAIPFVAVIALAPRVRTDGHDRSERLSDAARLVAPTLLAIAAWAALDLALVDDPLPNTFHVKAGVPRVPAALGYILRQVLGREGASAMLLAAALIALGVARAPRRDAIDPRVRTLWVACAAAVVAMLGVALSRPIAPAVRFFGARYFLPFLPLFAPLVALGLEALTERRPAWLGPLVLAALLGARAPALIESRESYGLHCAEIATLHTAPALHLRTLPADAIVGVEGAGAARWFGERRIVDLLGLNDHRIAHLAYDGRLAACAAAVQRPTYLLVPDDWLPALAPMYEIVVERAWSVDRWAAVSGTMPRRVVLARARLRPEIAAQCEGLLRDAGA